MSWNAVSQVPVPGEFLLPELNRFYFTAEPVLLGHETDHHYVTKVYNRTIHVILGDIFSNSVKLPTNVQLFMKVSHKKFEAC